MVFFLVFLLLGCASHENVKVTKEDYYPAMYREHPVRSLYVEMISSNNFLDNNELDNKITPLFKKIVDKKIEEKGYVLEFDNPKNADAIFIVDITRWEIRNEDSRPDFYVYADYSIANSSNENELYWGYRANINTITSSDTKLPIILPLNSALTLVGCALDVMGWIGDAGKYIYGNMTDKEKKMFNLMGEGIVLAFNALPFGPLSDQHRNDMNQRVYFPD